MASGGMGFTNPRIVEWMIAYIHRPLNPGEDILNNPMVHAGWVGIFITALNLMPIGQLDGGHVLYCLIGRRAHWVARGLWFGGLAFAGIQALRGQSEYLIGWSIMLTLLWMMGTRHPPTSDDNVPLGWPRILLGWATLSFVLVGFIPTPMYFSPPANSKSAATTAAETNQATSAHETDQESPEDPN
ncbi:MAG: hypothetical protein JSS02_33275 [Planctomycetes bacterium]|nr:hypothetical protein [Planctomycetota bacterium]